MKSRTVFLFILGIISLWFLYVERAILSPFILAAVFAYLFNPIISFASKKTKMPRGVTILIVYGILIGIFVFAMLQLSSQVFQESSELRGFATHILQNAKTQLSGLPIWIRPTARQLLTELQKSRFFNFFNTPSLFPFVSQAISRVVSFFIFLFSGYYFLNDGEKMFQQFLSIVPEKHRNDVKELLEKINQVLSGYLRGEVFLIILMGVVTYIALAIIGVRFAVSIAIFSGFAEIIPYVGPIVAATVAVAVTLFIGGVHFGLSPLNAALIVIGVYFVLRQLEDYFVIPHVMGSITKLPPFIIFFSVVAGGHIGGVLGLILAVPVAAILRLLLEFFFIKLHIVQGSE